MTHGSLGYYRCIRVKIATFACARLTLFFVARVLDQESSLYLRPYFVLLRKLFSDSCFCVVGASLSVVGEGKDRGGSARGSAWALLSSKICVVDNAPTIPSK